MAISRRHLLTGAGVACISSAASCADRTSAARNFSTDGSSDVWSRVRNEFDLIRDYVDLSALLIASHPRPVQQAIERYRQELDTQPVLHLEDHNRTRQQAARKAAAGFLGGQPDDIALTDSTTMGLGLVYNGLKLRAGDEILTTENDYYATHEALRVAAQRTGATVREMRLYDDLESVSVDQIVTNVLTAIHPNTRVVALTWVHSSTGLKIPLAEIGAAMRSVNARRGDADRLLLCVDGVHGFGVEDLNVGTMGCDFFVAGCHKWLFGPKGTGVIWGHRSAWAATRSTIPSFIDGDVRDAWLRDTEPDEAGSASRMTPGGFKPFEHQWALPEAFQFHLDIGKGRIAARTHELASRLKDGLRDIPSVKVITPASDKLSAGIVCFEVRRRSAGDVVRRLRERHIIATVTPYATTYPRFAPSVRNTPNEIDAVIREIQRLA